MKKILFCLLMALPTLAWAGDNDDFGTWLELGATKDLPHNLSLGLGAELRTDDNSTKVDRISIGPSLGYKVNKYFKLGVSYNFLDAYSAEKKKIKTSGYNLTESYWTPKHRLNLEATVTVKVWKWLRISARERYQFTHIADVDSICTQKIREEKETRYTYEDKAGYNAQYIRSRIKFEVDKKHLDWSPFVSVEFHNCINQSFHLHKLRTTVGTGYKINKHNEVSLAYVLTNEFDESPNERMHAISASYEFDF